MKKVKLLLALAILFMVSSCELSPEEIEPNDFMYEFDPDQSGEVPGDPLPPPPN